MSWCYVQVRKHGWLFLSPQQILEKKDKMQSVVLTLLLLQLLIKIQIKEGAGSVLKIILNSIGNAKKCRETECCQIL